MPKRARQQKIVEPIGCWERNEIEDSRGNWWIGNLMSGNGVEGRCSIALMVSKLTKLEFAKNERRRRGGSLGGEFVGCDSGKGFGTSCGG